MKNLSLELPQGLFDAQQTQILNERLRQIQDNLGIAEELRADLDAAGKRIKNLGDGKDGADALNQRTADGRYNQGSNGTGSTGTTTTTVVSSASGSTLYFAFAGPLSIQADAAPLASIRTAASVREIVALLKEGPDTGPVSFDIQVGDRRYLSMTIPAKATQAKLSGSALGPIQANQPIRLHITAVGLAPNPPGNGLTVEIRFL